MILPSKHLPPDRSLICLGAEILSLLDEPRTISGLWTKFQLRRGDQSKRVPFDWFVLATSMLFVIGAVRLDRGRLKRGHER